MSYGSYGGRTYAGGPNQNFLATLVAATLSLVGPANLTKSIGKPLGTVILSFSGSGTKSTSMHLPTAVLTFTGAFIKAVIKASFTAVLTFTGGFIRQSRTALAGTLTFTVPTNPLKSINKGVVGALSFTGGMVKLPQKVFTATLAFVGSIRKSTSKVLTAGISFTGAVIRTVQKILITAGLTFSGLLGSATIQKYFQNFVAVLTFNGTILKQTTRAVSLVATITGNANLSSIRWYTGVFKQTSLGLVRATYRTIQMITQNRNLH